MTCTRLHGIINVDEAVLDPESRSKVRPERLHAITLGRMVSGGDESNAALAREMDGLLGDFAGQVNVDAEAHRVFKKALRRAGAPCDAANAARELADDEGLALKPRADARDERRQCDGLMNLAVHTDVLLAETAADFEAELAR